MDRLQISTFMTEDFRITAKFKPLPEEKTLPAQVGHCICVRQADANAQAQSTVWRRVSSQMKEQLVEKTASLQYQCTYLDHECTIEVQYESLRLGTHRQTKILKFGPVTANCLPHPLSNTYIVHIVLSNHLSEKCMLEFTFNQILLKSINSNHLYGININDIKKCYVEQEVLVFPTLYERVVCLKVFREIINKGHNYSDNNHPLKLTTDASDDFNAILLKINSTKKEFWRRNSQANSGSHQKSQKVSNLSTDVAKKSDIKADSDDSFCKTANKVKKPHEEGVRRNLLKNSQFIVKKPKDSNLIPSQNECSISLQGDANYLNEFENVLYDENEQEPETLALNESFEELEKKPNSIEQKFFLSHIQKMRETDNPTLKQLYIQLEVIGTEQASLLEANKSLKQSIRAIQGEKKHKPSQVQEYLTQLEELKQEYGRLLSEVENLRNKRLVPKYYRKSEQAFQ